MPLPFNQESWIWYTCAIMMIAARIISRKIHLRSVKSLQYDDWIMGIFVTVVYTALIVCSNRYVKVQSNLLPPGFDIETLTPDDISRRRFGSKLVVVVEQTQIATIWACKVCLLIMYHRLTRTALRNENIAIRLLAAYVAFGFVIMEVLYWAVWCRPVYEYWAVPTDSDQCNALYNHRITKAVFNLSSDIIMLVIALQMLVGSMLPLRRKLILCGIFSLGIFVIVASVLNSYYSFRNPYKQTWTFWYVRESSTAILVANLPFTWTIIRETFGVGNFDGSSPAAWTFHSARTAQGRRSTTTQNRSGGSASNHKKFPSPTASRGSHGTQPMSLVDSMSPLKHSLHSPTNSPHISETDRDLIEEEVLPRDFGAQPSPSAELDFINSDLEHGRWDDQPLRPVSPAHVRRPLPKVMEDGTGGFYINDHPVPPPPRSHLAPGSSHSREPSLSRVTGRAASPGPSLTSVSSAGGSRHGAAVHTSYTAGTGRSAQDRRKRARLSE